MAKEQFDIRKWAVMGAEQRLLVIAEEARAIFQVFPELRGRGRGFRASGRGGDHVPFPYVAGTGGGRVGENEGPNGRRRRRKISAAERKAISQRMKKYWAGRRKAQK